MPITDLLLTGVNLMLMGMGIVFFFLVILVFTMLGVSKMAMTAEERQAMNQPITTPTAPTNHTHGGVRVDLVAVISAAVSRYRATHH